MAAVVSGRIRPFDWRELRAVVLYRDGFVCQLCGDGATEADHIWPRAEGGPDELDNLQAVCSPCNKRKGGEVDFDLATLEQVRWSLTLRESRLRDLETEILTLQVMHDFMVVHDLATAGDALSLMARAS